MLVYDLLTVFLAVVTRFNKAFQAIINEIKHSHNGNHNKPAKTTLFKETFQN